MFEYSKELHDRIRGVHNTDWKIYDENYPVDNLYFFQGDHILMTAVPYEGTILFCGLNERQKDRLMQIDDKIAPNLHPRNDLIISSEVIGNKIGA